MKHLEVKVWAVLHVIVLAMIAGTTTAVYSRSTSVGVALSMVCGAQLFVTVRAILRLVQFEE